MDGEVRAEGFGMTVSGMENIEALVLKIDSLIEVNRSALDVNRETLSEIKKQGDVMALQIQHQNKEIEELKTGLRDASDARKAIYARIEKQERRCAAYHGECQERSSDKMETWWNKKIAWVAVAIGGPTLGILGTKIIEKLF
jgi:predicted  nucleic acid-binding Zn-ribbon protein